MKEMAADEGRKQQEGAFLLLLEAAPLLLF